MVCALVEMLHKKLECSVVCIWQLVDLSVQVDVTKTFVVVTLKAVMEMEDRWSDEHHRLFTLDSEMMVTHVQLP